MSGTPENAAVWADGAVYVAFLADTPSPTNPADIDAAFGADWDGIGLLDGEAGIGLDREMDETRHYAWGHGVIKTTRRNELHTFTFTAVEGFDKNGTLYRLAFPGSTSTSVILPGKNIERVAIAFEVGEGDRKQRFISSYEAEVVPDGTINLNETDLSQIAFRVTVYADPDTDELYTRQSTETMSS
jgi:hypothetical protein